MADLLQGVRDRGWSAGEARLEDLLGEAHAHGWSEVPMRRGDPAVSVLTPTHKDDAHPRSLSASVGHGRQPLHTDGAHLPRVPDLVLLFCELPNSTPTHIWKPELPTPEVMRHGLFVVSGGRGSFMSAAYATGAGFRYDPGCMTPGDTRAIEAAKIFSDAIGESDEHPWASSSMALLLDNRRVLHARGAIRPGDESRKVKRVAFYVGS